MPQILDGQIKDVTGTALLRPLFNAHSRMTFNFAFLQRQLQHIQETV